MAIEGPLTAAQIYEQITGGEGTGSLGDAQDGASQLTDRMVERAQRISALRAKTMSGWRGRAGDAAADATLPLVQAAADDAVHLRNAQAAVGAQMDAFGTAKHSVKPVPPQPPELGIDDVRNVLAGRGWDSYSAKVAGWQADSQGNIDAFGAYHSASTDNGGRMPAQYARLADSGSAVSMSDHSKPGPTDTGEWARNPNDTRVPPQDRQTVRPGQDHQVTKQETDRPDQTVNRPPSQVQKPFQPQAPAGQSDTTHANSYVPRPVVPPAAQGGYVFGPTGSGSFSGDFGPGTGGGYFAGTGTGTGIGTGPETGTGPGSGRGTTTGPGTGYRPGTRTPGNASGTRFPDERLAGPGTNPTRTTPGSRGATVTPMGTPAGGRGKDEDREKKRAPYLQNPDPDETFGGFTEKPMPPVIGEKKS
ncbi:PPE domain-containing protein [Amycolatopsis sp. NPDC004625]|uniref:PPE domain-containing protein n=1 Tax=Amycolatopsis sp. NPDC004625 TaxID=3154670 RepID=UPI0033B306B5